MFSHFIDPFVDVGSLPEVYLSAYLLMSAFLVLANGIFYWLSKSQREAYCLLQEEGSLIALAYNDRESLRLFLAIGSLVYIIKPPVLAVINGTNAISEDGLIHFMMGVTHVLSFAVFTLVGAAAVNYLGEDVRRRDAIMTMVPVISAPSLFIAPFFFRECLWLK